MIKRLKKLVEDFRGKRKNLTKRQIWLMVILIGAILIIWVGYLHFAKGLIWADWTGFGDYTGSLTKDQRGKNLWDWLQLLIVPLLLAIGGLWFNAQQNERAGASEKDRQLENALQTYLDKMAELLLANELMNKKDIAGDPAVDIAKIRTVTTLRLLDMDRRNILLQFLIDAELSTFILQRAHLSKIDLHRAKLGGVDLSGADLSDADLSYTDLSDVVMKGSRLKSTFLRGAYLFIKADMSDTYLVGADLSDAYLAGSNLTKSNLMGANLHRTRLIGANLSGANFLGADLSGADLSIANLYQASISAEQIKQVSSLHFATMPDGSKHT